ncbi:MAG TPA: ABC transporter permease [Gemmatimonadales bacterium]|nr:ABC transporter permease [Gemmatimonadales bacterium]
MSQSFSRAFEGIGIALDSLRASKVRAALTILGVAIGVMVVIAMASAITGINRALEKELESAGPRTFFVQRFFQGGINISDGSDELSPWRRNPWITVEESEMIRQLPAIQEVSIDESTQGPVKYGDTELPSVGIAGFGPAWVYVTGGEIVAGRSFTAMEYAAGARVAVINDKVAEALFPGLDPIGKTIKIFGQPFQVIGLHVAAASLFGGGDQARLAIPHTTFEKVADYWKGWMSISVMPVDGVTVEEAQDQVVAALRGSRGLKPSQENNFAILTQDRILETFDSMTSAFFLVMLALSSVGLMVGGVGVVAIMMISVTERTREIGVRKALGATRREVLFQFLVEAATLTLVGGVVGMMLGGLIALSINKLTPIPAAVPLWSVVVALLASIVTGIMFGMYPANKASKLDPVEALRYE